MSKVAACYRLGPVDSRDLADGLFDKRHSLLTHATAGVDDAIHSGRADAGAGRDLGDAWPALEQGLITRRVGPGPSLGLM